jgi:beta-N-acetylhexosaminidase
MTGHLIVPDLDELPATLSRRILTGLLREELGFDGLVITDALEMRAISGGVGVEEAAVQALAAGVDALCIGHDLHEETVDALIRAISEAARTGRLPQQRLEEAAHRVAATATWAAAVDPADARGREVGAEAARRALRIHGSPSLERDPLIVELVPDANIAAGVLVHSLADLWPGAVSVRLDESVRDPAACLPPGDRPLVIVARDALRYAWQQAIIWELLTLQPDAVVIETGIPGGTDAAIETHGSGRANLEAARDVLAAARV